MEGVRRKGGREGGRKEMKIMRGSSGKDNTLYSAQYKSNGSGSENISRIFVIHEPCPYVSKHIWQNFTSTNFVVKRQIRESKFGPL